MHLERNKVWSRVRPSPAAGAGVCGPSTGDGGATVAGGGVGLAGGKPALPAGPLGGPQRSPVGLDSASDPGPAGGVGFSEAGLRRRVVGPDRQVKGGAPLTPPQIITGGTYMQTVFQAQTEPCVDSVSGPNCQNEPVKMSKNEAQGRFFCVFDASKLTFLHVGCPMLTHSPNTHFDT